MRKTISAAVAMLLVSVSFAAHAATPTEFYQSLLQRGILHLQAGDLTRATTELRIAAFGLVDAIDGYQTAQVHIAIAFDRMGNVDAARDAATRVVTAERISPRYATLDLPAAIRAEFERVAAKSLTGGQFAALRGIAGAQPEAPATSTALSSPQKSEPVRPAEQKPPATQSTAVAAPPKPASTTAAEKSSETRASTTRSSSEPPPASNAPPPAAVPPPAPVTTAAPERASVETAKPVTTGSATTAAQRNEPAPTSAQPLATTTQQATAPVVPPAASAPQSNRPEPTKPATPTSSPASSATTAPEQNVRPVPASPSINPPAQPARTTAQPSAPVARPAVTPATRFSEAAKALEESRLADARAVYRGLLAEPALSRDDLIRAAEGLYRARDFAGTLEAFQRVGTLRGGEEPWRFYLAVALYETGDYEAARRELAAAIPHIRMTPDVERYRAKIDGAIR